MLGRKNRRIKWLEKELEAIGANYKQTNLSYSRLVGRNEKLSKELSKMIKLNKKLNKDNGRLVKANETLLAQKHKLIRTKKGHK